MVALWSSLLGVPCCVCNTVQLGFSTTPKYLLRNGQAVFSVVFNSINVFNAGVKYVTFKAVATLPSGSYFDARVAQVVNYATGALTFSTLLSNSGVGSVAATAAPDGNFGFMYVAPLVGFCSAVWAWGLSAVSPTLPLFVRVVWQEHAHQLRGGDEGWWHRSHHQGCVLP